MNQLQNFTNLYPLSKTLRFELIPQGKTLYNIETSGMLEQDQQRATNYILVKEIIDRYHKAFIDEALSTLSLDLLEDYYFFYQISTKDDSQKNKFEEIQSRMRKQIADKFSKHDRFKTIDKKELIKNDLKEFVNTQQEKDLISQFDNFTAYFSGYHNTRMNMYSPEAKSTSIAYRLINQNLPKFIDNMRVFEKICNSPVKDNFTKMLSDDQLGPVVQVISVEDLFSLDFFNTTLTQRGIDVYNQAIGGFTTDQGQRKVQGLNEYINLHNQTVTKDERLPLLRPLYKQILSDRTTASFIPDKFKTDNEVLESITKLYDEIYQDAILPLKDILLHLTHYDLNRVYLKNDAGITNISQKIFGDWGIITKAIVKSFTKQYKGKAKPGTEKWDSELNKYQKGFESFSINFINESLLLLESPEYHLSIEKYFIIGGKCKSGANMFQAVEDKYSIVRQLLNNTYPEDKNLSQQQRDVDKIKQLLDSIKDLQWFLKPLLGSGKEPEKDERFYGEFSTLMDLLDQVTPLYDKVRNYMTAKPYSTEKIKLNFDNSLFLSGWARDYDTKAGLLFFKDGKYYLGINNKKLTVDEKNELNSSNSALSGKRIILDFQKPDNKNIPRLFIRSKGDSFAPAVAKYNLPINEVIDIYDSGKFKTEYRKTNEADYKKSLSRLIDYFKEGFSKHESYNHYSFCWKETSQYKDISEFYKDVEVSCYQVLEETINWESLMEFVETGKIYLFQIYNKDFSSYSSGTPNLHTLYWKILFDKENTQDVVYKLNGQAEMFFRKASIQHKNRILHKANRPVDNKNELNPKKQNVFQYDLIKDKRYTVDKFQFHVPITMNFKATGINNINPLVNEFIRENEDIHIIGINRAENHLLYIVVIDSKGNIVKQFSLNEIINEYNGNKYHTNYSQLLNKREAERNEARLNWSTIEGIKTLKEGYLSQVIHQICQLIVQYNGIVVLEDLNMEFKQGRQKVEKSVYQQFEKMLIDKLNYLVDKKKSFSEVGGTLKALQLTNKFESFQKMGRQSGFMFYVPAWFTSNLDPATGFVNMIDTRYQNIEKSKELFSRFADIRYNEEKEYFEFEIKDYTQFNPKSEGTRQNWIICTFGTRIEKFRNPDKNNQWDSREIDVTECFKALFEQYNVNFNENLKEQIVNINDKAFFEQMLAFLYLTLQMRNSEIGNPGSDYIISPVCDTNGRFFDSRTAGHQYPENASANGAYNIARKGLYYVNQIKQADDIRALRLGLTNNEWLKFVQD